MAKKTSTKKSSGKKANKFNPKQGELTAAYRRGKKWGYAVGMTACEIGGNEPIKAGAAMRTTRRNADTGCKKLTAAERQAYRGASDGIYDALKKRGKI